MTVSPFFGERMSALASGLTEAPESASMKPMNRSIMVRLRDFMDDQDGWGTEEGRVVHDKLLRFVEAHPAISLFKVSLDGVRRTDASFPRESVVEVARRYRKKMAFSLVDVDREDLLDNWDAAAQKKEQPIVAWTKRGHSVLGPKPSQGNIELLEFVLGRFETRASDAADALHLKLTNASTKLKLLWEQGYILRREETANTGGIEYVYSPTR